MTLNVPGAIAAIELSGAALGCEEAGEAVVVDSTSVCMGDSGVCSFLLSFIVFIVFIVFICSFYFFITISSFTKCCAVVSVYQDKTRLGQRFVLSVLS
jgi:hypothetical protein